MQINPSRFNSDFLLSILSNFILIIVSIFQGIIIARALGPSGKGVTAVYMTMFSLVYAFSNLGIRQSSAFYISKKSFNYDKIFTIQLIFILFSSIITLLAMILISISQGIYNYSYLKYFYFIVPLNLFNTYITSFALAERNITILNLSKVVTSISLFSILFFFYFINSSKNIEHYFLAQSASLFVTAILLFTWTRIKKINLHFYRFKSLIIDSTTLLKKGIPFALALFIYGLNFKLDILILNNLLSESSVGIYSVGVSLAEIIWNIPSVLGMIFFSYSLSSKNEKNFSNELLKKHNKIMGILIPIILLYGIITYFIIPIIFGINFDNAKFITLILLPGTYAITSFNILNADLSARGFPKYGLIIFTYGALSNIVLNIILIPIFDIYGSALSSTISYIFCSIIFYYKYISIIELKS